jgi:hypothetical protein
MLVEGNRTIDKRKRPFDLDEVWAKLAGGLTLEQFMLVGFGYFAGTIGENNRVHVNFASNGMFSKVITADDCAATLKVIGATYDEFRSLAAMRRVDDDLFIKSEFNPLVTKPVILRNREAIVPIPRLLAQRITDQLYYDIANCGIEEVTSRWYDYHGHLFEHYVGRLLKWAFGDDRVISEPSYNVGRERWDGPDWIVIEGDTALLFEVKSRRLSLPAKVYGTSDLVTGEMKKLLVEAVRKFPIKMEHLKSGAVGLDISGVTHFKQIVVVYDRIVFEEIVYRREVRDQLQQAGAPPNEDYILMDIMDLESLTGWNAEHPMKAVLEGWPHNAQVGAFEQREDFADYINRYAVTNKLTWKHPWLDTVAEEFFAGYGLTRRNFTQTQTRN